MVILLAQVHRHSISKSEFKLLVRLTHNRQTMARLIKQASSVTDAVPVYIVNGYNYTCTYSGGRYGLVRYTDKYNRNQTLWSVENCSYGSFNYHANQLIVYIQDRSIEVLDCLYVLDLNGQVQTKYFTQRLEYVIFDPFLLNDKIWLFGIMNNINLMVCYFDLTTQELVQHSEIKLSGAIYDDMLYTIVDEYNSVFYMQDEGTDNYVIEEHGHRIKPYPNYLIHACSYPGILWCSIKGKKDGVCLINQQNGHIVEYDLKNADEYFYVYEPEKNLMHIAFDNRIGNRVLIESFACYTYDFYPGCSLPAELYILFLNILLCRDDHSSLLVPELLFLVLSSLYGTYPGWSKSLE